MNLQDFHFIRPEWLFLFVPFVILFGFLLRRKLKPGNWQSVCDEQLLPYLLIDKPVDRNWRSLFWFVSGGVLAILAMAGPAWEQLPSPIFRNDAAVVIVLDLSASMDAQDIKPSRLERARFKVKDILEHRKDGQTALVVYAGDAFTVTPLTEDTETISNMLSALSTSLLPVPGSNAERGLIQAEELLKQAGSRFGNIVLITDGVNINQVTDTVQRLASENYRVSVLGVGTEAGAPIPLLKGGFLKDGSGNIVIPRLPRNALNKLAELGDGGFQVITSSNRDIDILSDIIDQRPSERVQQEQNLAIEQWDEKGPWLLLLLLPIAAFAFRKGVMVVYVLAVCLPGQDVYALNMNDLWATRDQQGERAFQGGKPEQAAKLFENKRWKAAAEYAAGEFEQAVETLDGLEDSDSLYNRGNALAKSGHYQEALGSYDQALEADPNHQDALYNRKLIKERLKRQQTQQQNSKGQDSDEHADEQQSSQQGERSDSDSSEDQTKGDSEQSSESSSNQNEAGAEPDDSKQHSESDSANGEKAGENEEQAGVAGKQQKETDKSNDEPESAATRTVEGNPPDESQQANEQWLRRIPDDPGRLLREKFRHQYKQRQPRNRAGAETW